MRSSENGAISALRILDQDEAGLGHADFGDGGGDRRGSGDRFAIASLHRRTAGRDRIDQVGIDQQRRMLEHAGRDVRLIGGERENDGRRRVLAEGQRPRERGAHQRRRIVEQHDQRAFGGGAIVGREIGIEIGARQCAGRIGALGGGRGTQPLQELTNNHVSTDATMMVGRVLATSTPARRQDQASTRDLINRSP